MTNLPTIVYNIRFPFRGWGEKVSSKPPRTEGCLCARLHLNQTTLKLPSAICYLWGTFVRMTIRILILLLPTVTCAQVRDSSKADFSWSGYMEAYYSFDFNRPDDGNRPSFISSFNRHNEINVNLGFLKGSYSSENVRGNMTIMTGTYANKNLASEPGVLRNIYEANAGVKLSEMHNVWVDAGIFASHIGFESAIGRDSWNLTRSILADNTPYYESGVKISYINPDGKWFLSGLILNGWQRIQRLPGNSMPSFGTQVVYKPSHNLLINSSTFVGTDSPDSARLMRYFHNFYAIVQVSAVVGITAGFDYGVQQRTPSGSEFNKWLSPVVIARFTISKKSSMDVRAEYYDDRNGVIIRTGTPGGFRTSGASANFDYKISSNALWRIEARRFRSQDATFKRGADFVRDSFFVTTSLAIAF